MNETVLICSRCTYPFVALDPNAYDVAEPVCGICRGDQRLMADEFMASFFGIRPRPHLVVEKETT